MPPVHRLLALAWLLAAGEEVRADCVGETPTLAEVVEQTGVFFVGEVVSAERGPYGDYGDRELTIRVSEWWGTALPHEVTVFSSSPGGGYALDGIGPGDVITVSPTVAGGKLVVGMCAPYNGVLSEAEGEIVRPWLLTRADIAEALGPGSTPTENSEYGSSDVWWPWWAASGAGIAFVIWRQRQSAAVSA